MAPIVPPPTEDQKDYLIDLAWGQLSYILGSDPIAREMRMRDMLDNGQLDKTSASRWIDTLLKCDPDPTVNELVRKERKNERYARKRDREEQERRNGARTQLSSWQTPVTPALDPKPALSDWQKERQLRELAQVTLTEKTFYTIKDDSLGEGHVYAVKRAHSTNKLYVLQLDKGHKKWDYGTPPGIYTIHLMQNIGNSHPLTVETAAEIGQNLNWCIVCGRALTDDLSKLVGIGPVCIKTLGGRMTQQDLYNQMRSKGTVRR